MILHNPKICHESNANRYQDIVNILEKQQQSKYWKQQMRPEADNLIITKSVWTSRFQTDDKNKGSNHGLLSSFENKSKQSVEQKSSLINLPIYKPPSLSMENDLILSDINKRRYSSSCFYGQSESNFPTIEEQVAMCRKIASQLVNDENLKSKGSTMFHKRVKRAPKWVHQSSFSQEETTMVENENKQIEDMKQRLKEEQKQSLKLILDPRMIKTVESLKKSGTSFNEHNAVSPEVCLHLVNELRTPDANKGAKIFMKRKEKSIEWEVDENQASKEIREKKERKEQEASQCLAYKPPNIFHCQDSLSQKSNKVIDNNIIFNLNSNLQDTSSRDSYTGKVYSTLPQTHHTLQHKSISNSSLTSRYQLNRDLCLPRTPKGWIPKAASMESLQYQPQICEPNYCQLNLKSQKEWKARDTLLNSEDNLLTQSAKSFNLKSKNPITMPIYRNFNSIPRGFCKYY